MMGNFHGSQYCMFTDLKWGDLVREKTDWSYSEQVHQFRGRSYKGKYRHYFQSNLFHPWIFSNSLRQMQSYLLWQGQLLYTTTKNILVIETLHVMHCKEQKAQKRVKKHNRTLSTFISSTKKMEAYSKKHQCLCFWDPKDDMFLLLFLLLFSFEGKQDLQKKGQCPRQPMREQKSESIG